MRGDFSRLRFERSKNYVSVLQQQGRVALDADANEQCAINDYLRETETVDVIGRWGGPRFDYGFKISVENGGIQIGKGRYYVEGILCENDESLAYSQQCHLINPNPTDAALLANLQPGGNNPNPINVIQVYLEVWQRMVTGLDDPCLLEPALGQADTTVRLQTVWRVVAEGLNTAQKTTAPAGAAKSAVVLDPTRVSCCKDMTNLSGPKTTGKMMVPPMASSDDCACQPTPPSGYRGVENQLYRVEIHESGDETTATFKWSRDNGSVVVAVNSTSGTTVNVNSLGSDANLGFAANQWVEISDDTYEFGQTANAPGNLYQIQGTTPEQLYVTMYQPVPAGTVDATRNARMRRWDQFGSSATTMGVPLSVGSPIPLENGIQVQFTKGYYQSGDYWLIPARTATGNVEWPPCGSDGNPCQPPHHIEVYRAPLACIQWDSQTGMAHVQDCRKQFYPLNELSPSCTSTCCTYRVGDGVESFGDFTSIQTAIDRLPAEGGEVCILPGRYYENVRILNRRDVVIHGCGWQTRVASLSLKENNAPILDRAATLEAPVNPIAAVFSIVASRHIQLRSFAIEAADDEAGILMDGTETSITKDQTAELAIAAVRLRGVIDVTIEDMVFTAATFPAVLAEQAQLLRLDRNRVAMKNVRSQWPAIYASGTEIHIDQNWVGVQSAANNVEWLPYTVTEDLSNATTNNTVLNGVVSGTATTGGLAPTRDFVDAFGLGLTSVEVALHPGSIQIGGPSTDVYIIENEIVGGSRNGITLGSLDVLNANGGITGIWTGITTTSVNIDCDCTGTLQTSPTYTGTTGYTLVAGGILTNVQIHRNSIRNMGLCGIGPVAFFDLSKTQEIISIVGLNISANSILRTLLSALTDTDSTTSVGYGAICVSDVQNLIVRDNTITDFGSKPGVYVCGIFVLHGELIDISRNQVLETRDWNEGSEEAPASTGSLRGGIVIVLGTPPTFTQPLDNSVWIAAGAVANADSTPIYEPGLPAVRVEHNVVRIPMAYTLFIVGWGPFSIVNNHLASGGLLLARGALLAQTVLIINLGTAIEVTTEASLPSAVYHRANSAETDIADEPSSNLSCGTVLFANNSCQLEASASRQRGDTSVLIVTPDHLTFSGNHCWLDASRFSVYFDALLLAGTINVIGNRFQEKFERVLFSGLTFGVANVTCENISTNCLKALGVWVQDANNISIINRLSPDNGFCASLWKDVSAALG